MKAKIIYGSDTGNTDVIARDLGKLLDDSILITVDELKENDWEDDVLYILGIPTWYDGELQSDWEDYFEEFKTLDFTGKTVAIFGLGDQLGYEEWFCDGIGILAEVILENSGKVIGYTAKDDSYELEDTPKSLVNDSTFYGLCLDEDNQYDLSQERLEKWVKQLKKEYKV